MNRTWNTEAILDSGQGKVPDIVGGLHPGRDGFLGVGERRIRTDGVVDFITEVTWEATTADGAFLLIRNRDWTWVLAQSKEALYGEEESPRQFPDVMPPPAESTDAPNPLDTLMTGRPPTATVEVR